jgi:hypothetical protein
MEDAAAIEVLDAGYGWDAVYYAGGDKELAAAQDLTRRKRHVEPSIRTMRLAHFFGAALNAVTG